MTVRRTIDDSRLARLLLLTIVLIAYGSLYPWHFRAAPSENPLSIVIHSWPRKMDSLVTRDIAVNVVVYAPLGLFAFLTFASIWRSLLLGFVLSTFVEIAQVFVVGRIPSLLDITTDTVGTAIGITAGILWGSTTHRHARRPDSALLLSFWVLSQCFPFLPRLHPSVDIRVSAADVLLFFAEALALVVLVQKRRVILGALLLIVPLKAFVYTRSVTLAEILCSAAVFAIAWFRPPPARVMAVVLAIAVVIHGLSPYHFLTEPHAFSWVPFQASFFSEWESALTIMLGKVFAYGTLVWLIRESGVRLVFATAFTAVLLASIEVIQMYLPGRSSEIIDPLIAVILGWVFWSLKD